MLRAFAESSEMFLDLLNHVKYDLIRTHLHYTIQSSNNG